MMWFNGGAGRWLLMALLMLLFWAAVKLGVVWLVRGRGTSSPGADGELAARRVLDERLARGEIDADRYRQGLDLVLPLAGTQAPGTRTVGHDGKVSESGSLGEVSATCRAGAGNGLTAGSTGWTTLTLPAGRYELTCNLPGNYTAYMYTELDVNT